MRKPKIVQGRWFKPGMRELVAGKALAKRYEQARPGGKLKFGKGYWNAPELTAESRGEGLNRFGETAVRLLRLSEDELARESRRRPRRHG